MLQLVLQCSNNFWATIAILATAAATVAANMTTTYAAIITLPATTKTKYYNCTNSCQNNCYNIVATTTATLVSTIVTTVVAYESEYNK